MKKLFPGVMLAAVVYFVWCAVAWMVIPFYNAQIKRLPEESLIRDTLKVVVKEPGLYMIPSQFTAEGVKLSGAELKELWTKGPVGVIAIALNDSGPINPKRLGFGILNALVTALLVGWILFIARNAAPSLGGRILLSAGLGFLVWMAGDYVAWNWSYFPLGYILVALADRLIGFALLGLTLSPFIAKTE